MEPYILCAAVWYIDNYVKHESQPLNIPYGLVICGRRHSNCFVTLRLINDKFTEDDIISGFITSNNLFLSRTDAAQFAWNAKQLLPHIAECPNSLISEMLYEGDDL